MIFKYKDYKFSIPDKDLNFKSSKKPETIGQRMKLGQWESEEVTILTKYLHENDKVIELGACVGFLGVVVNDKIKNKESHMLIEANPEMIPVIEENKKLNGSKFKIEHCIIGNPEDGERDFRISNFILGSSVFNKGGKIVKVPVKDISEYSNDYNFLIVDIEGGEYELIKNNINEIMKFDKLLIEFHPFYGFSNHDIQNSLTILKKSGFTIVEKKAHVYMMIQK
jgi:FkbM family methyltransferase